MKITQVEMATTSTGKPYKKVTLDGQVMGKDKFNIFTFHTRYEDVVEGLELKETDFQPDGQYIKLVDPDAGIKGRTGGSAKKNFNVAAAQERKAESIQNAQHNKELGIKTASTINGAVQIVVAKMAHKPDATTEAIEADIKKWREWLWKNWEFNVSTSGNEYPLDDPNNIPF